MNLKCPKCKSKNTSLTEIWENYLHFDVIDNKISHEGILNPGSPIGVIKECLDCHHTHKIKNITQITQLKAIFGEY